MFRSRVPITHPTYHRPRARLIRGHLARASACALAVAALGAAPAGASTLVVTGAGDGHGVGMSQDGALGFARHGFSYEQILAHYYTGTTIGMARAGSAIRVLVGSKVVKVPLERYVRGVVAAEMPANWPAAALEAQAVASRTYALTSHAGGSQFDVYSDARSQVYRGVAAETNATNAAVAATAGQVILYAGRAAITYFFASSGGSTENIENSFLGSAPEPWLRGVADPYETASSSWQVPLSFTSAAARLQGLVKGSFKGIEVLRRGVSPRVVSALVLGSAGSTPVNGPELASRLGLSSTWAFFSVRNGSHVRPEPDRSGRTPPSAGPIPPPSAPAPSTRTPPSTGPGGAQAPGASGLTPAAAAASGGAPAG
ncbi:MAG TPA: SpoIID/LytB domain-containing protein [Solirubrobacteraceae bacterium]|nr:SpoIID/LytB domain-containing protein [Solirubrobacteraceae bacterium]